MQICILSGSHRDASNSLKCANYLAEQLKQQQVEAVVLDLNHLELDIWSADFWSASSQEVAQWQEFSKILSQSDGFIVVAPEYGGMVPPLLKNFLLKCSGKETGNKPVMLVGVSAGVGGTYPLVEMRNNAFKNNHMCVIPQAVILRKAGECLNGDTAENETDQRSRDALAYAVQHLLAYAEALSLVREKSITDYQKYPYGV